MTFLPETEKEPIVSNYMKFEQGENRFRVLSSSIVGMEYWVSEGDKRQPIRKRMDESIPVEELGIDKWGNPETPKYFWAFVVWNYDAGKVQILEITQSTIRKMIKAYVNNKKYGDPKGYDFVVTKSGEAKETEYAVVADPPEKIDPAIEKAYKATYVNLESLFENGDPFTKPQNDAGEIFDKETGVTEQEINIDDIDM